MRCQILTFRKQELKMYAVVKIKDRQYRVEPETRLEVPLLDSEVGTLVDFENVLMTGDGEDGTVGDPLVRCTALAKRARCAFRPRGPRGC